VGRDGRKEQDNIRYLRSGRDKIMPTRMKWVGGEMEGSQTQRAPKRKE